MGLTMNGPGKAYRKGISPLELYRTFPDAAVAERRFEQVRWEDGVRRANCDGERVARRNHPSMLWRCADCRKRFSAKGNAATRSAKVGCRSGLWRFA